ncbi:hypothetical protein DL96DRAFT_1624786 [Flagelloscypha sp. PMI_526]|nr:hypothetical protein DL96DRAFT_1624786 [Flagelloscypha sp. PMI_526]
MATVFMSSIRTPVDSDDDIEIVNQLLLPHTTEYLKVSTIEEAHEAIKSMKIRGAPAIASLAALTLASVLSRDLKSDPRPAYTTSLQPFKDHVNEILNYLFTSRPTAVNLGQAIKRLRGFLDSQTDSADISGIIEEFIKEARNVAREDVGRNKEMSRRGGDWLLSQVPEGEKVNVLTVCNTGSLATSGYGTALGLITYLFEQGKLGRAYFTQTGPYHQGSRLTALELQTLGIPSTMICDTMVGSLFQNHKIHGVAVGADRIAQNGDTANKIGTYQAAVLASRHKIPFIVVAPITTVDLSTPSGADIPIEQRPAVEACLARGAVFPLAEEKEQRQVLLTPPGMHEGEGNVYNPSFDVTPADLISAVVTEKGVAVRKDGQKEFDLNGIV